MTIRAKTSHKRSPEEWIVIEDCHDPIVTHEEYDKANATIRKVRYNPPKKTDQRDRVYFCGHCGRRLRKTFGLDEYYSCATQLYKKEAVCKDIFWSRSDLENVLLAAYRSQLQLMSKENAQIIRQPSSDPVKELRLWQKAIEEELASTDAKNLKYYEAYRNGSITREAFLQKKSELVQRKELLAQEKGNLQEQVETLLRDQRDMKSKIDQLAAFSDLQSKSDEELRKQMYDAIDRVTVYCSRELDITWKMGNIFAGTFEKEPVQ